MADALFCHRAESCPLLIEEAKNKMACESEMRIARHNLRDAQAAFDIKRHLFNEFYKLVVSCRNAQRKYFAEKTQAALIASKEAEKRLDAHLEMLRKSSSRQVVVNPELNFGEVQS